MKSQEYKFQKSVTRNGIRVVTENISHVRSISLGIWFKVGSRWEDKNSNGISHVIEHMVFKGTKKRNAREIAQSMESVGATLNAFTTKEATCFYAHFLDEYLPVAVDVLSDLTCHPRFSPTALEREKQVIIEEINSLEDTPDELVHEYFQNNLFEEHPLSYSILGSRDTIQTMKRKDITNFWRKNYTSDRIVVAAAGNVNHNTLTDYVENAFCFNSPINGELVFNGFKQGRKLDIIKKKVTQAHICTGNRGIPYGDRRKYALMVLNVLLGGGMSSRLFQNIRERLGIAYNIYSFLDFYEDTGVFGTYIGTEKEDIDKIMELIVKEIKKFKKNRVSNEEIEMAKSQLKGHLMLGLESTESRMTRLARMEMYLGDYINLDRVLKDIENVRKSEVVELARELLADEEMHTTMIVPDN